MLSILIGNWNTWYIGGADSKSRLRFLKLLTQNPFLSKFGPQKSKLSFLLKNWRNRYLEDADSYSNISFLNFQPKIHFWENLAKKSKFSVFPENWRTLYLEHVDSYFHIIFLNFQPKIHFWAILALKIQSCSFCLKISTYGISRMLILIPTLAL